MEDDSATTPDSHLSLLITLEECENLLTIKKPCKRHRVLTDLRDTLGIKQTIYDSCPDCWGCLEGWVRRSSVTAPPLEDLLRSATTATHCETNFTTRGSGTFNPSWDQLRLNDPTGIILPEV
jgi:hypothetical protein